MLNKEAKREYQREYMRKYRAGEKTAQENGLSHLIDQLEWKPIPGYPGYMASKCGQILSCHRTMTRSNGKLHTTPARVLKQSPDTNGHLQVGVYQNTKKLNRFVHRLVYLTWKGPISDDLIVDHVNGDRLNNHADNLQLLSNQMNVLKGWEDAKKAAYQAGYAQALKDIKEGPGDVNPQGCSKLSYQTN